MPETSLAENVIDHGSLGGFHTHDPVAHNDPPPVTEGAEFSVPSSSIPTRELCQLGDGSARSRRLRRLGAGNLKTVDLTVNVRASLETGVKPLLASSKC